jgi:hypothetical protein
MTASGAVPRGDNVTFTGQCREEGQRAANWQKTIFFFRLALTLPGGKAGYQIEEP